MRPQVLNQMEAPLLAQGVGSPAAGIIDATSRHRRTRVAAIIEGCFSVADHRDLRLKQKQGAEVLFRRWSQIIVICDHLRHLHAGEVLQDPAGHRGL